MKQLFGSSLAIVASLVLAVSVQAQQAADPAAEGLDSSVLQVPDQAAPPRVLEAPPVPVPDPEARGLQMDADGSLTAQVSFIQGETLQLQPVEGASVSFVQNRQLVAQARTGPDGRFSVQGLAPWAVYSIFVHNPEWFAAFSSYVQPYAPVPAATETPVANTNNELTFTAEVQSAQVQGLMNVGAGSPIQAVPTGDLAAFMGTGGPPPEGLGFGEGVPFAPPGLAGGFGGVGGGMGGGAGGGAGGGGIGGIGGLGAAMAALAVALGLSDDDDFTPPPFVSPFTLPPPAQGRPPVIVPPRRNR